jgi:hypothetical protein
LSPGSKNQIASECGELGIGNETHLFEGSHNLDARTPDIGGVGIVVGGATDDAENLLPADPSHLDRIHETTIGMQSHREEQDVTRRIGTVQLEEIALSPERAWPQRRRQQLWDLVDEFFVSSAGSSHLGHPPISSGVTLNA